MLLVLVIPSHDSCCWPLFDTLIPRSNGWSHNSLIRPIYFKSQTGWPLWLIYRWTFNFCIFFKKHLTIQLVTLLPVVPLFPFNLDSTTKPNNQCIWCEFEPKLLPALSWRGFGIAGQAAGATAGPLVHLNGEPKSEDKCQNKTKTWVTHPKLRRSIG